MPGRWRAWVARRFARPCHGTRCADIGASPSIPAVSRPLLARRRRDHRGDAGAYQLIGAALSRARDCEIPRGALRLRPVALRAASCARGRNSRPLRREAPHLRARAARLLQGVRVPDPRPRPPARGGARAGRGAAGRLRGAPEFARELRRKGIEYSLQRRTLNQAATQTGITSLAALLNLSFRSGELL